MPIPLTYDEYTASTLPDAATMDDRVIYRTDLHQFWHSDGLTWRVLSRPDYDAAWSDSTGTALVDPSGAAVYGAFGKDAGLVDARNYGIYGDDADYTTELQEAIDDLDARQSGSIGMRSLVLPPGQIRFSSTLILKRVNLVSATSVPNAGTRLIWYGTDGGVACQGSPDAFNDSFLLIKGINFRNSTSLRPLHWLDFSTYLTGTPATDVMFRLRELHLNGTLGHAIKVHANGWVNCHWEHLRFDQIGDGFAILLTSVAATNLSTFVLDGFTYDHTSAASAGWGVIGVDNSALATNVGTVELANGRIETGQAWATRVTPGTLGSGRAIFQEYTGSSAVSRSVGWRLRNVTYSDSSGMADDAVVFRNTSAANSDYSVSLVYDNVRAANLAKVFTGAVAASGRLDTFRVGSLTGVGAVNPSSSSGTEGIGFGNAATLTTDTVSPNGVRTSSRGSLVTVEGSVAQTLFVKEVSDTANTGWARVETAFTQTITYAASITPAHNSGNVASVGTLTGNLTVNAMTASGTYVAGLKFRFLFTSDASARTITWNAAWKGATLTGASAANQKAIVEFTYDGANWVQTFSTGWYS